MTGDFVSDCLKLLKVVEVECGNRIAALDGSLEHLSCVDETKLFVIYCHEINDFIIIIR